MINIADILKVCPKGTKLYSPICGNCKILKIYNGLGLDVINDADEVFNFSYDGRYNLNGECLLFPSKDNRDWNTFRPFKDGDIISNDAYIAIFHKFGKPNFCAYDKVVYYHCWCYQNGNGSKFEKDFGIGRVTDFIFATDEEKQKLFDVIKENGYKWNSETKTLEKLIVPKFKVEDKIHPWTIQDAKDGDVIFYDSGWTCIFKRIHGIWYSSYCFITSDGEFYTGYEEHAVDSTINGKAHPATKEQCNFLFQKIKESGYKWNAETKTLEKLVEPKFKVGDKIVKKNGITNPYIVNSVSSDYYGLTLPNSTGIAVLNVYEQDEWELAPVPKFKVGDIVKTKNTLFDYKIIKITDTRYTLESIPGANTYDMFICEDENWKLVPTHKFKVGDKVKHIHTGVYCQIKAYADGLKGYYTSIGHFIKDENVAEWEIIPNKFDISTLKAYDKVLVRDTNGQVWTADLFSHIINTNPNLRTTFVCVGHYPNQCIPYLGNEHLLGTCDDCSEYYKIW